MSRNDELEATNWLHTAVLGAICNHLQHDPRFAQELSLQLTMVQARLEAGETRDAVLDIFCDLRRGIGL